MAETIAILLGISTVVLAFALWRSIRKASVSKPCRIRKTFIGLMAAPVLRSGTTRARAMKAAAPKCSL